MRISTAAEGSVVIALISGFPAQALGSNGTCHSCPEVMTENEKGFPAGEVRRAITP